MRWDAAINGAGSLEFRRGECPGCQRTVVATALLSWILPNSRPVLRCRDLRLEQANRAATQEWWDRALGADGRQRSIRAVDLRPASSSQRVPLPRLHVSEITLSDDLVAASLHPLGLGNRARACCGCCRPSRRTQRGGHRTRGSYVMLGPGRANGYVHLGSQRGLLNLEAGSTFAHHPAGQLGRRIPRPRRRPVLWPTGYPHAEATPTGRAGHDQEHAA